MSQRIAAAKSKRRRGVTLIWIAASAIAVFLLIYFEQTALLYVLATLGVTILLFIVATSDIGHVSSGGSGQPPDAQAASSGVASNVPSSTPNQKRGK